MSENREVVLVTGGTGMIGMRLRKMLQEEGYEVLILSRQKTDNKKIYHWDVKNKIIEREALEKADHIIHLAGAGIADERWTDERKKVILDSRLETANLIFESVKNWNISLKSFISASAIGYYGDKGSEWVTEESEPGEGFLSEVCKKWEDAADQFKQLNIRTAKLRIGLVLSMEGGMLKETYKPVKFGAAPYFGDGKQYYSWVHMNDVCRGFIHLLKNSNLTGAYNMTGSEPVINKEYMKTLKKVASRPALSFGVPVFVLKIMLGEMSQSLLDSLRVSSKKIEEAGFKFEHKGLKPALTDLLKK